MKNSLLITAFSVILFGLGGCYPGDVITNEETDIVITHHEEEPDFSSYSTYSMPNELIVNPDEEYDAVFEAEIIAAIAKNMEQAGYTRIDHEGDNPPEPDLLLIPSRVIIQHYASGGCYYCWGWYPGWPGWPGYYPPYPPTYVVSYRSGTIVMTLVDATQEVPAGELPDGVWSGAINGLLRSSITAERIESLIDQAFDQSPYLNIN